MHNNANTADHGRSYFDTELPILYQGVYLFGFYSDGGATTRRKTHRTAFPKKRVIVTRYENVAE
jgi:hypothetical protein